MANVTVYNDKFDKVGEEKVNLDLSTDSISVPAVHQVVKAILAGRRAGTACTKTKGKVSGGGAKPFKQKGTGNARQGSSRSPLMPGGGTAFGPTPRDFTQKVNKKMIKKAITSILADKNNENALFVIDNFKSEGKTKDLYQKLVKKNMLPALIVSETEDKVLLAAKNLQWGTSLSIDSFNVYEAVKYKNLVIGKNAFNKLLERLV